jgi:hypothetical protein
VDSSSIKAHPHAAGARHTPAKADAPKQEAEKRGSPRSRRSKKRPPGKSPKWLRKRWGAAEAD